MKSIAPTSAQVMIAARPIAKDDWIVRDQIITRDGSPAVFLVGPIVDKVAEMDRWAVAGPWAISEADYSPGEIVERYTPAACRDYEPGGPIYSTAKAITP